MYAIRLVVCVYAIRFSGVYAIRLVVCVYAIRLVVCMQ